MGLLAVAVDVKGAREAGRDDEGEGEGVLPGHDLALPVVDIDVDTEELVVAMVRDPLGLGVPGRMGGGGRGAGVTQGGFLIEKKSVTPPEA